MAEVSRQEIDVCGAALLARLALDPACSARQEFDALLYPFIWGYLKANHATISARVAARSGSAGLAAPLLPPHEVAEAAHAATVRALERVRNNAARFDPERGTASAWSLRAAEFALVEIVKTMAAAQDPSRMAYTDHARLVDLADQRQHSDGPLEAITAAEALSEAASVLGEREWQALRLTVTLGYSYADAAQAIFGDSTMIRQIEGLVRRGKRKLAAAWEDRRPLAKGASATNAIDNADDEGEADE